MQTHRTGVTLDHWIYAESLSTGGWALPNSQQQRNNPVVQGRDQMFTSGHVRRSSAVQNTEKITWLPVFWPRDILTQKKWEHWTLITDSATYLKKEHKLQLFCQHTTRSHFGHLMPIDSHSKDPSELSYTLLCCRLQHYIYRLRIIIVIIIIPLHDSESGFKSHLKTSF